MTKITMQRSPSKSSAKITLDDAFLKFINFKKIKNLSKDSLTYYEQCFHYFTDYYPASNTCETIDNDVYLSYIQYLQNKTPAIKDITINSYLRGLRVMLYYFMKTGYMDKFDVELIRADKDIKETYTDTELGLLLKKPDLQQCSFAEYRCWVLETFLLGTGVRISTATSVKINDIDLISCELIIRKSKSRKQKIIPLSVSLCKIIKEYLEYRNANNDDEFIFCTQFGKKLSLRGAQSAIKNYNHSRNVDKTSAHVFRHTFAKNWILNGGDIFTLQKMLGHSTLDMVKEYVNLFDKDLHIKYDEYNPLDKYLKNGSQKSIKMNKN